MANFWTSRTAVVSGIAITLLGALYVYQSSTPINFSMSQSSSSNNVPGLEFKLTQTTQSPPTLLVTLKNTSPDTPYTLLKWGTPLDSSALNTGVFSITHESSGEEVEQMVLQINRKMPPPESEIVTVAAGAEEEAEVVFDKPWMPDTKPAKYKIKASGMLKGVWAKPGNEVTEQELYAYSDSPFAGRTFATNEVVMEVQ
jgi:hypothetical protein